MFYFTLHVEDPIRCVDTALLEIDQHWVENYIAKLIYVNVECVEHFFAERLCLSALLKFHFNVVACHVWKCCQVPIKRDERQNTSKEAKYKFHPVCSAKNSANVGVHLYHFLS